MSDDEAHDVLMAMLRNSAIKKYREHPGLRRKYELCALALMSLCSYAQKTGNERIFQHEALNNCYTRNKKYAKRALKALVSAHCLSFDGQAYVIIKPSAQQSP